MKLFYQPNISKYFNELTEEESYHCSRVLRLKNKDIIYVTDGKGNLFKTEIVEINSKRTIVEILEVEKDYGKLPYYIHIAIAPTKNIDRFEWFVEKSVEIGINEITPIICKNSERKIVKNDRLNRIAESAMKQSYKTYHPKINEQQRYSDFIKLENRCEQKFIAFCEDVDNKEYLGKVVSKKSNILILIGPEGDFTIEEIQFAINNNLIPVSLGRSRLRTETAGVIACDIVSVINQI